MWIFSRYGFFSIVAARTGSDPNDRIDPGRLMVRARVREHLTALQDRFADRLGTAVIHESPTADYAYRLFVDKRAWADVLAALAEDVDYDNFKAEVGRRPNGTAIASLSARARRLYEEALHDVWSVMFRLQRRSVMRAPGSSHAGAEGKGT